MSTIEGSARCVAPMLKTVEGVPAATPLRGVRATRPVKIVLGRSDVGAYAAFRGRRRFGSLDGLRCVAILGVILHHCWHSDTAPVLAQRGFLGVDLFFVLSGFLIVTLLLREREESGGVSLRAFYMRRTLRIFPVYYVLLTGLAVVFMFRQGSQGPRFFEALPYLVTYTADLAPIAGFMALAWSLAAEEQFYMLWPPVEKLLRRKAVWWVLGAALGVNQAVNFGLLDGWLGGARELNIAQITFTPILLGVALAHVLHHHAGFDSVYRWVGGRWAAGAAAVMLAAAASAPWELAGALRLVVQLLMAGLIASCVVREDHALSGLLKLGPVARVGVVSYGMYLFHGVAQFAALMAVGRYTGDSSLVLFGATVALTWGVAEVSYRWYESPLLALKHRFTTAPAPRPMAAPRLAEAA